MLAIGADAGNAFAEAPPPDIPFDMSIDDQYREWWTESERLPPIPLHYLLPVQHALQGHPEAPWLWENHIHHILVNELKFIPTTHEKCLYWRRDFYGFQIILRQVDDFAISASTEQQCRQTIQHIGTHLQVPLNDLGIIRKFNGVNIHQTNEFLKITCEDYLHKILTQHQWLDLKVSNLPVSMRQDPTFQRELESMSQPSNTEDQQRIQQQAGFSYREAIGELIYAMIVARPDISFAVTKLSQYSMNPALIHYTALNKCLHT